MSTKTSIPLKDLAVGDIIYTKVLIDIVDVAYPESMSGTTKKFVNPHILLVEMLNSLPSIRRGSPVKRLAVVLVAGSSSVQVAYLATFNGSAQLPTIFADKSMWYPISPATKESIYDPVPGSDDMAQWACLRMIQTITVDPVGKVDCSLSAASAKAILDAMKA